MLVLCYHENDVVDGGSTIMVMGYWMYPTQELLISNLRGYGRNKKGVWGWKVGGKCFASCLPRSISLQERQQLRRTRGVFYWYISRDWPPSETRVLDVIKAVFHRKWLYILSNETVIHRASWGRVDAHKVLKPGREYVRFRCCSGSICSAYSIVSTISMNHLEQMETRNYSYGICKSS